MTDPDKTRAYVGAVIEIAIKMGALALLIGWCFLILKPFISPVVWGIIMAVAVYPLHSRLTNKLGNRAKLASTVMVIVGLLIIILPSIKLTGSMIDGVKNVNKRFQSDNMKVPAPPEGVRSWPIIGSSVEKVWREASVNLTATLHRFEPQIKAFGSWLVARSLKTGVDLLLFAFSIIISGILLAFNEGGGRVARDLFVRLAGERGAEFAEDATVTVRNVVKGILGVAVIQALLAGIGFGIAGVPGAGLS